MQIRVPFHWIGAELRPGGESLQKMFYAIGCRVKATCNNSKHGPPNCTLLLIIFLPGFRLRDAALDWLPLVLQRTEGNSYETRTLGFKEEAFCRTRKRLVMEGITGNPFHDLSNSSIYISDWCDVHNYSPQAHSYFRIR
jgi:hypothetical protein